MACYFPLLFFVLLVTHVLGGNPTSHKTARPLDKEKALMYTEMMEQLGLSFPHLALAEISNSGVGIIAAKPIHKGDTILSVPFETFLSSTSCLLGDIGPLLSDIEDSNTVLTVCLMYEKHLGPRSYWWNFIRLLPEHFDTLIFYDEEELKDIEGLPVEGEDE